MREILLDEKPWQLIEERFSVFPGGERLHTDRQTIFDNGVVQTERLIGSIPVEVTYSDNPDDPLGIGVHSWATISVQYDVSIDPTETNGPPSEQTTSTISSIEQVNDNGTIKITTFVDGIRSEVQEFDDSERSDGTSAEPWREIQTKFDQNGNKTSIQRSNDDGTEQSWQFENGVLQELVQVDPVGPSGSGAKPWTSIQTIYDDQGQRALTIRENDNGVRDVRAYDSGQIVQIDLRDTAVDPSGDGAFSWNSITTTFDAAGRIARSVKLNDDGTVRDATFESGVLREVFEGELPRPGSGNGVEPRNSTLTRYDTNGVIASRDFTYDDGRHKRETFVDGTTREVSYEDGVRRLVVDQDVSSTGA